MDHGNISTRFNIETSFATGDVNGIGDAYGRSCGSCSRTRLQAQVSFHTFGNMK